MKNTGMHVNAENKLSSESMTRAEAFVEIPQSQNTPARSAG
jgi:hypothetical protein